MVNGASIYSYAWSIVKYIPSRIVKIKLCLVWVKLFSMILWWAHVTVKPEVNRINVFNRGICKGLNGIIPCGGHIMPSSIVGESLLWKKLQKNEIKKNTSEVINKIIPQRNLIVTGYVCNPWNVPSREMSRHHWYIINIIVTIPKKSKLELYKWNHLIIPTIVIIALKAPNNGHGLTSTKW